MSNYVEYNDRIAFHPGYYVKELVEGSGLTQEDFAKRLDTTPKNLSILIRGEQSLSIDIAMKLSRMIGTTVEYWLNLQNAYDTLTAEFDMEKELLEERAIFELLDYEYFVKNFQLPAFPGQKDEQLKALREFLNVSTLRVLKNKDLAVNFRNTGESVLVTNVIRANTMVQIAINEALRTEAPKFNKKQFEKAVDYSLTLTDDHKDFYPKIKTAFEEAGVKFVIIPNLPGSKTNGATKKLGSNVMLMVNDRNSYADSFWFTLFHEIGHVMNGDYGISLEKQTGEVEEIADGYARDSLIPADEYREFVKSAQFDTRSIKAFAERIDRDPGIVVGRLMNDGIVGEDDQELGKLRHRYKVQVECRGQ